MCQYDDVTLDLHHSAAARRRLDDDVTPCMCQYDDVTLDLHHSAAARRRLEQLVALEGDTKGPEEVETRDLGPPDNREGDYFCSAKSSAEQMAGANVLPMCC
jgi:hypothetical protein